MYDIAIIGGGPSGLCASIYAASEGYKTICVVSDMGGNAAKTSMIENYPGFPNGVAGSVLMDNFREQAERFEAILYRDTVESIEKLCQNTFSIHVKETNTWFETRSVLLAVGQRFRPLDIPGVERVHYGPPQGDMCRGKAVCIIGGANSAGQAALFAARSAHSVEICCHSPIEKEMSAYLYQEIQAHPRIVVKEGVKPVHYWGDNILYFDTGYNTYADSVFIMAGMVPNTDWLPSCIHRDEHGYIMTDTRHLTSLEGCFASGDCRRDAVKRCAVAVGEGASAIEHIEAWLAAHPLPKVFHPVF